MSRRQLASTLRVLRAVLRSVPLRRVMLAFLLLSSVQFGSWVAALLWAYDVLGPASVGLVALLQLIPPGLFAGVAAAFVDRYPAQRVLLAGYVALAATTALTAVAMALAWPPAAVIALGASCVCAMTMVRPAQGTLLPVLARTPEELTAANAIGGSVDGLGMLLGPLAAAVLFVFGPPALVFAVSALAALAATAMVVRLPMGAAASTASGGAASPDAARPDVAHADAGAGAGADDQTGVTVRPAAPSVLVRLMNGASAMVEDADGRLILALLGAQRVVLGALDVLYILLAMEILGTGASGAGVMGAAVGLGFVAGGIGAFALVGRRRLTRVLVAGGLLTGGAVIALGAAASPSAGVLVAPALIAAASLGAATMEVTGRTVLQRVVSGRALTRVLSALEGVQLLAWGLGSILAPILVLWLGVTGAVMAVGLILPAAVILGWLSLQRIDQRVKVPVRELAVLQLDPLLAPLPAPTLETVASGGRWITLEPGHVLIREGDPGDRYYVLESGALRITKAGRLLHEDSTPGYGIGEIALLRDVPRTATVTAIGTSVLLAVERADFLEAVTGHEQAHSAARRTADDRERLNPAGPDTDLVPPLTGVGPT